MPAPLDVNKEEVRMLVLSVGVREAARQLDLPPATVSAWSARGKWLADVREPAKPTKPASMQGAIVASKPADLLAATLAERRAQTRLGLSEYVARASRAASELPDDELLARSVEVKAVASVAESVWPAEKGGQSVHVSIFGAGVEPATDVDADVERLN